MPQNRRQTAAAVVSFARGEAPFPQAEARSARVPSISIVRSSASSPPNVRTSAFAPPLVELFIAGRFVRSPTQREAGGRNEFKRSRTPRPVYQTKQLDKLPAHRSPGFEGKCVEPGGERVCGEGSGQRPDVLLQVAHRRRCDPHMGVPGFRAIA